WESVQYDPAWESATVDPDFAESLLDFSSRLLPVEEADQQMLLHHLEQVHSLTTLACLLSHPFFRLLTEWLASVPSSPKQLNVSRSFPANNLSRYSFDSSIFFDLRISCVAITIVCRRIADNYLGYGVIR